MFAKSTYERRRAELRRRMPAGGLILLPGNGNAPANYPNNAYAFRQDSSFLYYFGLQLPDLVAVMDIDSGEDALYGDDATVDDIIWTGPQPTLRELGGEVGVERTYPLHALRERLRDAIRRGRCVHFLPPYRGETKLQLGALLGIEPAALHDHMSVELVLAVAAMREQKDAEEIEALERAFLIGYQMHTAAMRMCRPGVVERQIAGAITGIALQQGAGVSFPPIVSQHGETLHNLRSDGVLESGRLLLVDAGAETLDNYCSDHTRTYPVNGKFTERQRDIYRIVLAAHAHTARTAAPGMMYSEVHRAAYLVMARGLIELGLLRGQAEEAVAAGAMELFMPHGLGHGMGMDVHDCEAFGERSFDFSLVGERADEAGACIMRSKWRLRPGTVMSDEPGIYFIPALIDKWRKEGRCAAFIDYDKLASYYDFGGIRIEDDLLITEEGNRMIGSKNIPVTIEEIEAFMAR